MAEEKRRRRIPIRRRLDDEEDEDDLVGPRTREPEARPRARSRDAAPAPAKRAARSIAGWDRHALRSLVREIPNFGRLLWGLARDPRVSKLDKGIVVGAITYAFLPADVIPDWIPVLGEVEDAFLLALALSRLLTNAGDDVLLDHWEGDEETLEKVLGVLESATELLPTPVRGLLGARR